MDEVKIPNHVAIIVDGNGRWAKKRGLSRSKGHEAGFKNIQTLTSYIYKRGVKYISAYLFSTENFKRSEEEVGYIMNTLLVGSLKEILDFCKKEKIRAVISGRKENFPNDFLVTRGQCTSQLNPVLFSSFYSLSIKLLPFHISKSLSILSQLSIRIFSQVKD